MSTAKTQTFKLFGSKEEIVKAIVSIGTLGAKIDRKVWVAAVSAMAHHNEHGDVTIINDLVSAMPKGSRVNALRDYILAHGKVSFDNEVKAFTHAKDGFFDLEGALAVSWVEFKPEPEYKPLDALKLVTALAKRIAAADADKGDVCSDEQAAAILALAANMGVDLDA
tara:strand:- start:402 stop:902 length:501 start_codon:yes stop_codon:yes gene_type:complete